MSVRRIVARRIADGSGGDLFSGRITADNGMIVKIERGSFSPAADDIFADENEVVAPAFIDAHGHSDISLLAMPEAEGKTAQGIGCEISGNCGLSPFPLTEHNRSHLQELYFRYGIRLDWIDFNTYMQRVNNLAGKLKLFALTGHNTLRAAVAGYSQKQLTRTQLVAMCRLLEQQLTQGSAGLSFGLLYTPGYFADEPEIVELMRSVASQDKICTVHLKSEGDKLTESIDFMLSCARRAGLKKLHLSHLKTAGKQNFHKLPHILRALESCDLRVTGDIYCYDAAMTQLSVILPAPFDSYDDVKVMALLKDEKIRAEVLQLVRNERCAEYWQNVRLINGGGSFEKYENMFLDQAAKAAQLSPEELFLAILAENSVAATAAFHTLSGKNMQLLAAHPSVVPGSDESARNRSREYGVSHPRGFGNHARYFRLRREQGAEVQTIIREMTLQIAEIFALEQVGAIRTGRQARFTVLDTEKYSDNATFADPHKLAAGARLIV